MSLVRKVMGVVRNWTLLTIEVHVHTRSLFARSLSECISQVNSCDPQKKPLYYYYYYYYYSEVMGKEMGLGHVLSATQ